MNHQSLKPAPKKAAQCSCFEVVISTRKFWLNDRFCCNETAPQNPLVKADPCVGRQSPKSVPEHDLSGRRARVKIVPAIFLKRSLSPNHRDEGPGYLQFQKNSISSSRGVTLVEILISLTILVLVTAALSSGTNYLTRRLVRAKNATIARNLAWKKLAEIKARRIEKGQRSGIFGREFPGFSYSEKIESAKVGNGSLPALFNYELIVTWPEAWQEDRVTFTTLIADYLQGPAKIASETPGASP